MNTTMHPNDSPKQSGLRNWRRDAAETWRHGASAVLTLTFDLDAESAVLARSEAAAYDLSTMSHQAYGPQTALPRILRLLSETDVAATFFVPGESARRWPNAVEAILAGGHEVALHSDLHKPLTTMSDAQQADDLQANMEALKALGAQPVGYRAPNWQLTTRTLELLIESGLTYDSSLMDDDRPYLIDHPAGRIAELPVHWSLDDWEQYAFLPEPDIGQVINTPSTVRELWTGELDAMRTTGSLCNICAHPFLSGRPSRLKVIADLIAFAHECRDVDILRCDALAQRILIAPVS
ncbi:peptidoglycan/xylan/chitin deacetylase (PgdA/CDA1 family) [Mycobacterium sp. OAS707]|uniref:polysaccharide deacetylase family protein n=1 Tax=Mycobacterium sp. OAS707 TaxID=2663822 RepID=UPI0017899C4C|nr:polysaccharide deacetylase [Mycobacterium sp. OAS707]MBE1550730.1 peptidoglycan/xylan/chitin deacetylase (PgdA/CDA1 family) [Mycobacterium sp. OAS707]